VLICIRKNSNRKKIIIYLITNVKERNVKVSCTESFYESLETKEKEKKAISFSINENIEK
jgi:hypothetical protein